MSQTPTVRDIVQDVLRREGEFVEHPADHGGPTKYGITQATLADWRGRAVTAADVAALSVDEATRILEQRYVRDPKFNQVPDARLQALLVDYGVHSGPARVIRALQRVVGVKVDGVLGPQTLAAIDRMGADAVTRQLLQARGRALASLIAADPTQRAFAAGWLRRLMEFV
jgi:lysozyme family protein